MTLKFEGWPWKIIGHIFNATSSFGHHFVAIGWFQTGDTVRKRPIWVKIDDFESRMTLQFDIWPWKTIGHPFYATSSSMHHFVAIGEFKLELQSGNGQLGSKSTIFFSRVILKFHGLPWKTIGHLFNAISSFVHHFVAIGDLKLEIKSENSESGSNSTIFRVVCPWNLTDDLENKSAPLLNNIKPYASFQHHMCIQTWVTVRKRLNWVVTSVTLTFDLWPQT